MKQTEKIYKIKSPTIIKPDKDGLPVVVKVKFKKSKRLGKIMFTITDKYKKNLIGSEINIKTEKKARHSFEMKVPKGNWGIHTWVSMKLVVTGWKKLMKRIDDIDVYVKSPK